mmetsp:Transcript_9200/g.16200  ORF Transcript_9200/g.16200 Transcript_9200/m.16200 type:complete len:484 (-) Transcript_9200:288-1739(-)|eukprot:CAMPEP_0197637126 /NCGR_PEP_ID=MMETSP1338-20131121/12446_1 /TAXON_ID=43686 ORGANISM="Pelagodinium beii, Strain RCC1491" /NCGR_SAMPLE_ID=MMETSP1338 /ASSEMBLY_ACC=CAM_ASM_000754 /LENGTH=483 /DNA_ID=CAMNT_0043209501 /DNA_START=169 /DNA_END=1620 /DNA_ORIENTATION=+
MTDVATVLANCRAAIGEDDFGCAYEPWNKDGTYNLFRSKAMEEIPETFQAERSLLRYTAVTVPRVRRLVSVARSRELLRQKQELEVTKSSALLTKKVEEAPGAGQPGLCTEVDTEAEDSEVSTLETNPGTGRPTFTMNTNQVPDGCGGLQVLLKGPVHRDDEPPDFLQLPEPIKQRTAGAVRVAAAARAWAAASAAPQVAQAAGQVGNQDGNLPATARGLPAPLNSAAAIAAELQRQGVQQAGAVALQANGQALAEAQVVAGPAVLALRRMRNRMSALAEGRLPFFTRPSGEQPLDPQNLTQPQRQSLQSSQPQQAQQYQVRDDAAAQAPAPPLQPQPPQQPNTGQRRPLLPNLGARSAAAGSAGPSGSGAASSQEPASVAASSVAEPSGAPQPPPRSSAPPGSAGLEGGQLEMQSLVPAPPDQPKPPSGAKSNGFWRRSWPRVSMSLNPFGNGASSSGGPAGPSSSSSGGDVPPSQHPEELR